MPKADEELLARARPLRADPMPAETAMRHILRATQFEDVKFARQRVIAPYIADFVARSRRLGVEIDGDTHAMRDVSRRTAWLERQGYGVIRFTNYDAGSNLEGVAHIIGASLAATAPLSSPLPGGERKQR